MQPKIHNSLASGGLSSESRQKIIDKFQIQKIPEGLIIIYSSPNKHCGLFKELALWLMNYYGDIGVITETKCLKQNDPICEIKIIWNN
jgi:hypothetical protein